MYSPKYTISNNILKSIGRIEASKEIIENSPLIPSWERQFAKEAQARTVHFSTHLEGNSLDFPEVKKIVDGREEEVVARERDVQEVINYREVVDFIDSLSARAKATEKKLSDVFDLDLILTVHKILSYKILQPERCGTFREKEADLVNSRTGERVLTFPKVKDVKPALINFVDWIQSRDAEKIHAVLKSGITHYEITRIHPFDDQNGRSARALSTIVLYIEGYDIKSFFCLDEHFDNDSWGYYSALSSVQKENLDLTKWLEYFCEGLAIELNRVKEKVLKLSKDASLRKVVGRVSLNERQEKIIECIQDYGFINNKKWRKLFSDYSDDTILRDLQDLIKKGVIKKNGKTKSARYELKK